MANQWWLLIYSHVQSESHVRQVLLIGEDPKKYIEDYSKQFIDNFITLLRTTHGEKKVQVNQFYQQVIQDKEVSTLIIWTGFCLFGGYANENSTFT